MENRKRASAPEKSIDKNDRPHLKISKDLNKSKTFIEVNSTVSQHRAPSPNRKKKATPEDTSQYADKPKSAKKTIGTAETIVKEGKDKGNSVSEGKRATDGTIRESMAQKNEKPSDRKEHKPEKSKEVALGKDKTTTNDKIEHPKTEKVARNKHDKVKEVSSGKIKKMSIDERVHGTTTRTKQGINERKEKNTEKKQMTAEMKQTASEKKQITIDKKKVSTEKKKIDEKKQVMHEEINHITVEKSKNITTDQRKSTPNRKTEEVKTDKAKTSVTDNKQLISQKDKHVSIEKVKQETIDVTMRPAQQAMKTLTEKEKTVNKLLPAHVAEKVPSISLGIASTSTKKQMTIEGKKTAAGPTSALNEIRKTNKTKNPSKVKKTITRKAPKRLMITSAQAAATGTSTSAGATTGRSTKQRGVKAKFTIDCSKPVDDHILDPSGLETFFRERIKVGGKMGNLGDKIQICRNGKKKILVTVTLPFSKRYIKYLIKKYLRKQQLRDFLRVVATKDSVYELRYFTISNDE